GRGAQLTPNARNTFIEFDEREIFAQRLYDIGSVAILKSHLVQLNNEQRFPVGGIGGYLRQGCEARNRIQSDVTVCRNDAGTELDGGDVAFAGGSKTYDEAQCSVRNFALIGMRNNGRIEKRGGFERVFP